MYYELSTQNWHIFALNKTYFKKKYQVKQLNLKQISEQKLQTSKKAEKTTILEQALIDPKETPKEPSKPTYQQPNPIKPKKRNTSKTFFF